jgi:hypothetical protein
VLPVTTTVTGLVADEPFAVVDEPPAVNTGPFEPW